jgi:hypothetical protein
MSKKYSDSGLASASPLAGTERWGVSASGVDKYITPAMLATYISGLGGSVGLVARATNSGGTLVNDSATARINFDTVNYDPGADITTGASWVYTAPATAWYDIHFVEAFVARNGFAWVAGSGCRIDVHVNGSAVGTIGFQECESAANNAFTLWVAGNRAVSLTSGQTIDLRIVNSSGAQRELESGCAIEIYRVT